MQRWLKREESEVRKRLKLQTVAIRGITDTPWMEMYDKMVKYACIIVQVLQNYSRFRIC